MTKFNVGDWVYASGWCYGYITKIEDGFAVVEYDTGSGGGSCSFMFEDMVKAWPPKKKSKKREPIGSLYLGVDVKSCDQCEYKNVHGIRDNLLVTAGTRAVYMDCLGDIDIPEGFDEENKLAEFLTKVVDDYIRLECGNFDLYLEAKLIEKYGGTCSK